MARNPTMGEVATTEVDPMDDNRGSADYKRELNEPPRSKLRGIKKHLR